MSRRLSERSIDHVVLERGQVANSWRTQRWPSLRLLTRTTTTSAIHPHPWASRATRNSRRQNRMI
jgi:cation diffusion facilitator CzcD-associated flavoprotein CzcO